MENIENQLKFKQNLQKKEIVLKYTFLTLVSVDIVLFLSQTCHVAPPWKVSGSLL